MLQATMELGLWAVVDHVRDRLDSSTCTLGPQFSGLVWYETNLAVTSGNGEGGPSVSMQVDSMLFHHKSATALYLK